MAQYKGAASEGSRAMQMLKKRELAQEEMEFKKKKIEEQLTVSGIKDKFATHYDAVEQQLKSSTIGLVTLDEMKAKQEVIVQEREKQLAKKQREKEREIERELEAKRAEKQKQKQQIRSLSFKFEEDEEEEEDDEDDDSDENKGEKKPITSTVLDTGKSSPLLIIEQKDVSGGESDSNDAPALKKKKSNKNPDVDTSFLPDRDREEEENKLREELRQEWVKKQEALKQEPIEITYSYWDGSGHRKIVRMKKGNTIYQFLQRCLDSLRKEFHELRSITADQLMYVKEDLIIPHHYSFYDFIVTKARGKSGPLFSFDVHDDVRLISDASVEKDESHAGKVLLRNWYERNKHIFPASRWEPYDPTKTYEKYSIKDKTKKNAAP